MPQMSVKEYFVEHGVPYGKLITASGDLSLETEYTFPAMNHADNCPWVIPDNPELKEFYAFEDEREELGKSYSVGIEVSCGCGEYTDIVLHGYSCRLSDFLEHLTHFDTDEKFPYTATLCDDED